MSTFIYQVVSNTACVGMDLCYVFIVLLAHKKSKINFLVLFFHKVPIFRNLISCTLIMKVVIFTEIGTLIDTNL